MHSSTAYIGLDVHSRTCTMAWFTMAWMNEEGNYRGPSTFRVLRSSLAWHGPETGSSF